MGGGSGTGRGPLGTPKHSPIIDQGTSALTETPPPNGKHIAPLSTPAVIFEAVVMSSGIEGAWGFKGGRKALEYARGDERGRELLELWMSGTAPDDVTLDSDEWGDYMRAEASLQDQLIKKLSADAIAMRNDVDQSDGEINGPYQGQFHGEVGRKSPLGTDIDGGYFTGYEILHGSKLTVGDVQVSGRFKASRSEQTVKATKDELSYLVTYTDMEITWNDIINVNAQYGADRVFADLARWENAWAGKAAPKDYAVHIKWKANQTVNVAVQCRGTACTASPGKTFKNL
jgi:hypothetical protein